MDEQVEIPEMLTEVLKDRVEALGMCVKVFELSTEASNEQV